jgi:hypothetical protein
MCWLSIVDAAYTQPTVPGAPECVKRSLGGMSVCSFDHGALGPDNGIDLAAIAAVARCEPGSQYNAFQFAQVPRSLPGVELMRSATGGLTFSWSFAMPRLPMMPCDGCDCRHHSTGG